MKEIALALGGGGVRGIAHIGVIRRLEQEGYQIKAIAGTSAGGLIGAVYAAGIAVNRIEDYVNRINQSALFLRKRDDGPSLMGLAGVMHSLTELIGDCTFSELNIPFACTSVDLNTAQEIILTHGRVVDAVQATIAFPGVFPPKEMGGKKLVDGGVLDPVPVALARWLAPGIPIVAVCLSPEPEEWAQLPPFTLPRTAPIPAPILEQIARLRIAQAFQVFARSIDITSRMLAELRMQADRPDVIIRPHVEEVGLLDLVNPAELILSGDLAALRAVPDLEKSYQFSRRIGRTIRRARLPGSLIADQDEDGRQRKN